MSSAVMTDREIQRELEAEGPTFPLYNPSTQWIDGYYGGLRFPLCPDGEVLDAATDQVRTTDGVTAIRDLYGEEWTEEPETRKRSKTGNRVVIARGQDVVKHLLKTYGSMGLVRLKGNEKQDAQTKSESRKRWVSHRVKWASEVIANRDAYLREFHAAPSNAGQMPNPPNPIEMEAMEFMADYRTGVIGRKTFACQHDGYQTDDKAKWEQHIKAFHPEEINKTETTDKKNKGAK